VILTGNGRAVLRPGADIAALTKVGGAPDFMSFIESVQDRRFNGIDDLDRPDHRRDSMEIAYGGGMRGFQLCCDFRIIAEDTSIGSARDKRSDLLAGGAGGNAEAPADAADGDRQADGSTTGEAAQPLSRPFHSRARQRKLRRPAQALEVATPVGTQAAQACLRWGSDARKLLVDIAQNSGLKTGIIEAERQADWRFCTRPRTARKGWRRFLERREAEVSADVSKPEIEVALVLRGAGRAEVCVRLDIDA